MAIVRFKESPQTWGEAITGGPREFEDFLEESWLDGPFPEFSGVYPPVIITRSGDNLIVRAELPGMLLDDIDVSISGNSVLIKGDRNPGFEDNCTYHKRERDFGYFSRAVGLPQNIDPDKCEAFYTHGVLKIVLPLLPDKENRHVNIKPVK